MCDHRIQLTALAAILATTPVLADVHVPADYETIQEAIDNSMSGEHIVVAPGTYNESIDLGIKSRTLRSSGGPDVTIIDATGLNERVIRTGKTTDCNGLGHGVAFIEGFTITGGHADKGGGIFVGCQSRVTMTSCRIIGNTAVEDGGGLFKVVTADGLDLIDCTFEDNMAEVGGAFWATAHDALMSITRCLFESNAANAAGGAGRISVSDGGYVSIVASDFAGNTSGAIRTYGEGTVEFRHTRFIGNSSGGSGGALRAQSDLILANCLLQSNHAETQGGALWFSPFEGIAVSAQLTGCTIVDNSTNGSIGGIFRQQVATVDITNSIIWANSGAQLSQLITAQYSAIEGGWPGPEIISEHPVFVGADTGDFRLGRYSPCVDSGDNGAVLTDTFDVDGDGDTDEPIPLDVDGEPRFTDDSGVQDTGVPDGPGAFIVDMGAYERQWNSEPGLYAVPCDFGTIQAAVSAAEDDAMVIVDAGVYAETIDLLGKPITVRSSEGPEVTVIDGSGFDTSVVTCGSGEGPTTVLEGFTITGGAGTVTEVVPGEFERAGGGIFCDGTSPTFTQCQVTENTASHGAGMWIAGGAPLMTDCRFQDNSASVVGGGLRAWNADAHLVDCLFLSNDAAGGGGGIQITEGHMDLDGCLFVFNTASLGAGVQNISGTVTAFGCSFVNNAASLGGGLDVVGPETSTTVFGCSFLHNSATIFGGGIRNHLGANSEIGNCFFLENTAEAGGGIWNDEDCSPSVFGCVFFGNTAGLGGGIGTLGAGSSPTISYCDFDANTASAGGAVSNEASSPSIVECHFNDNEAFFKGGAVYNSALATPVIDSCVFSGNSATSLLFGQGGAMYNEESAPVVDRCSFVGNHTPIDGGALASALASTPVLRDCLFDGNHVGELGGAMWIDGSTSTVSRCIFTNNSTLQAGGAVAGIGSQIDLVNCLLGANLAELEGGAVLGLGGNQVEITNCTLVGNGADQAGAIVYSGDSSGTTMTNSILYWSMPIGWGDPIGGDATVTYCNIEGGYPGNIGEDPEFIDDSGPDGLPGTGDEDLRLAPGSVCIDTGNNVAVPDIDVDLEGNVRILDGDFDGAATVDMGAYESSGYMVHNVTQDTYWTQIGPAIEHAVDGDELVASPVAFEVEPQIDFLDKSLALRSSGSIEQPPGGLYVLADDALIGTSPDDPMSMAGATVVPFGDDVTIETSGTTVAVSGSVALEPASSAIVLGSGGLMSEGQLTVHGAELLAAGGVVNDVTGALTAYGSIIANVTNDGEALYLADTLVGGDYVNSGTTNVQSGTLTILGSLVNSGTIIGDVSEGGGAAGASGCALLVEGDLRMNSIATLLMPSPMNVRCGGHFDVAIDDGLRFDLLQAVLQMAGAAETPQEVEAMSVDIGPDASGLDRTQPGHFPVGTVLISGNVHLVNHHDNAEGDEALYVSELVVEPDATLVTNGLRLYYLAAEIHGSVDDLADLVRIADPCPADTNGDGSVDAVDLMSVILDWGPCPDPPGVCNSDVTGDGTVGAADLVEVITAWGSCP